jgi:glycosyltransferase involved in cell wall biosynthesis
MFIIVSVGLFNEEHIERNIKAVDSQTYENWQHYIVIDNHRDNKYIVNEDKRRKIIFKRVRNYGTKNIHDILAWVPSRPHDVVCLVDLDDYLLGTNVLDVVGQAYQNSNILLTYGSYETESGRRPRFNGAYKEGEDIRLIPWRCSHLKTFQLGLWNYFTRRYPHALKDQIGNWLRTAGDVAIMMGLYECAGHERTCFIPDKIYLYNDYNPLNEHKVFKEEQKETEYYIRHQRPCRRMP